MLSKAFSHRLLCKNPYSLLESRSCLLINLGLTNNASTCQQKACLSDLAKPSPAHGIFELRTCKLKPECVDSFKELKKATNELYKTHASPMWYWFSELGGMNEVVTLWKYDSYAHRNKIKNALATDAALKESYFSRAKTMLRSQSNLIMHRCPWYEMQFPEKPGVYELGTYSIKDGKYDQVAHRLVQGLETRMKYSKPVGIFFTDIGPLSRLILLWHYEDLDKRNEIRREAYSDEMWNETVRDMNVYVSESQNKILVPASFSPRL